MVTTVVIDSCTSYTVVILRSAVLFAEIRVLAFYFDKVMHTTKFLLFRNVFCYSFSN